jgi:hypothetical protein
MLIIMVVYFYADLITNAAAEDLVGGAPLAKVLLAPGRTMYFTIILYIIVVAV